MYCPVDHASLRRVELPDGPSAFACDKCAGHWVRFGDYLAWRERQPGDLPFQPDAGGEIAATATTVGVRRCPDCDYVLTRYQVGHGVGFSIDRCGNCNGIWLDTREWETL